MSKVEKKQLSGTVTLEGQVYNFRATVFRQAHYGAHGRIGATLWQFGSFSELIVNPTVPDRLSGHLELEILRRVNSKTHQAEEKSELKSMPEENSKNKTIMPIELETKIGDGAYADVWRATDNKLGRKVAVKVLRPSSPYYFDAMAHARALARAQHNNVVVIHSLEKVVVPDTGDTVDGVVMELIDGPTLQSKLEQSTLFTQEDIILMADGLISGLEHIHSVEMVHSDLHIGNVLIKDREAKIIDILYTDSLLRLTTGTKSDKIRRDMRDLTTILFDMVQHSDLPREVIREFGLALQDSTMSFTSVREALHKITKKQELSIDPNYTKNHDLKNVIELDRHNVKTLLIDYLNKFSSELSNYSINVNVDPVPIEERVWISFGNMLPCRDEFIDLIIHICKHSRGILNYKKEIIECLQQIAGYADYRRPNISYLHSWWNDNYKLFTHELFLYLIAALIKFKEYKMVYELTHETYYFEGRQGREIFSFVQFRERAESIEHRTRKLDLRLSIPEGTLFKDRATLPDISFDDLMQADFVLFLIALLDQPAGHQWFPVTLIYAIYSQPFKIFKQAVVRRYFEEIKVMFGVQSKAELLVKYNISIKSNNLMNGKIRIANLESISIPALSNLEELDSR